MYQELLDGLVNATLAALDDQLRNRYQPLGEDEELDDEERAEVVLDMLQGALLSAVIASATPTDMVGIVRYFKHATGAQIPIRGTIHEDGRIEWKPGQNPNLTANGSQ